MKVFLLLAALWTGAAAAQKEVRISFTNDYPDVYHLSLIVFTPDGAGQTRVSNLDPKQTKTYRFPEGTVIYVADNRQEAFAMRGNDIRSTGAKPAFVLRGGVPEVLVVLSSLQVPRATAPVAL